MGKEKSILFFRVPDIYSLSKSKRATVKCCKLTHSWTCQLLMPNERFLIALFRNNEKLSKSYTLLLVSYWLNLPLELETESFTTKPTMQWDFLQKIRSQLKGFHPLVSFALNTYPVCSPSMIDNKPASPTKIWPRHLMKTSPLFIKIFGGSPATTPIFSWS